MVQKGDFGQAQKVLQQALSETKDPEQQATLRFRLRCTQQQEQFHNGEWVDLLAGEDLVEWTSAAGQWKPTAPGEIEGIAAPDGLLATFRVPFSLPLEITGQVEFVHTPYALSNAAVLVCPVPRLAKATVFPGNSIIIFRSEKKVFADFDNHDIEPNTPLEGAIEAPVKKTTDFDILLWPEQVSVKINDKWITEKKPIDVQWGFKSDVGIGIGGRYWYAEPKLRFRNLKVRRLAVETP